MMLAALYSVFDGEEWLEGSIKQIRPFVDQVIASVQIVSYHGETYYGGIEKARKLKEIGLIDHIIEYSPYYAAPHDNELSKRNKLIEYAFNLGCSHFIHMDCDEYYVAEEFSKAKEFMAHSNYDGSVVNMRIYFKNTNLSLDEDVFKSPFIHQIDNYKADRINYPYLIDPTKTIAVNNVVLFPANDILLHHFAWVRKDIDRKVRNSSVRGGIEASGIVADYHQACEGYYVNHYKKHLEKSQPPFDLGDL